MSTKEGILRAGYTELAKAEKGGDWERGLKAANRILKQYQHESTAFLCKVVCMIQLSKFEETLTVLRKALPALSAPCKFEKAYCEYRLNRSEEAIKTLEGGEEGGGGEMDFRSEELLAQLLYRQEKWGECLKIYKRLLKESQDDYDQERQANLLAVEAHLKDTHLHLEVSPGAETYEQLYNEACALITEGNYKKALKNLTKAENMCREALMEEEAPDDEIEEEVALMLAQKAYCHQMMGHNDTAANIYSDILKQKPSDQVVMAVVSNNAVSVRKGEQMNLFDTRKKLKTAQTGGMEQKLTRKQRRTVTINNALLQLHSNQFEPCRKALTELKSKYGESEDGILIEACLLLRQKDASKASELLKTYLGENEKASNTVHFALAQMYLAEGKTSCTLDVLKGLSDVKWSPAVLSLLVSVSLGLEDTRKAQETLAEAVDYYKKNKPNSDNLGIMVEQCASLHAKMGDHKAASEYLEDLRKMKPKDPKVLARLIQAYSEFHPEKAESVCASLPPMERVGDDPDMDPDTLESSGWILLGEKYRQKKEAKHTPKPGQETEEEGGLLKKRRKKKRKAKLPKNMDPDQSPDPERWMPKFERSTYKKKKDKRAKDRDVGRGTQGAVGGAPVPDLSRDHYTDSGKPKTSPAVSSPKPGAGAGAGASGPGAGPRQQRPGGGQNKQKKKKKGKGGQW